MRGPESKGRRARPRSEGWRQLLACLPAIVLACIALPAGAGEITLDAVIRSVLEGNLVLQKQKLRIDRNRALLRQAKGKFDWNVLAGASVARKEVPDEEDGVLTSETSTDTIFGTTVGLNKTFRNGIQVNPRIAVFRNADNDAAEALSDSVTGIDIGVTVPLLRGAGEANAAVGELALQAVLEASEYGTTFASQNSCRRRSRASGEPWPSAMPWPFC